MDYTPSEVLMFAVAFILIVSGVTAHNDAIRAQATLNSIDSGIYHANVQLHQIRSIESDSRDALECQTYEDADC